MSLGKRETLLTTKKVIKNRSMFTAMNHIKYTNEEAVDLEAINTHEEVHISTTNQRTTSSFQNTPAFTSPEIAHKFQTVRYVDQSQEIDAKTNEEG
ncbi:hypothetical protein O181_005827 [Austropuccinia psidii MF-1]|uniref:Uncharacterized protein n=1 Tax=Austropuccinia psidii MF-1 TaxID=1389203 RepID=A0A9Q3BJI1_9BASI|nr:hypothetical protein [Austropuccinia psidii MF-1]